MGISFFGRVILDMVQCAQKYSGRQTTSGGADVGAAKVTLGRETLCFRHDLVTTQTGRILDTSDCALSTQRW